MLSFRRGNVAILSSGHHRVDCGIDMNSSTETSLPGNSALVMVLFRGTINFGKTACI